MDRSTLMKFMNSKIIPLTKGVILFIMVSLSLSHVFFKNKSPIVKNLISDYGKTVRERDSKLLDVFEKNNNQEAKEIYLNYKKKLSKIKKEKDKAAIEFSFNGRSSFHFWVFAFGLVTALFFFACKSLYHDIVEGSNYKFQFISITGIIISFFWFIHLLFYTQKDFNKNSYILTILLCSLSCSVVTYFFIKRYSYKDNIIRQLINLIFRIKKVHYKKMVVNALYAERNDRSINSTETVKQQASSFDSDVKETLKSI